MREILIGTDSWSKDGWNGTLYPKGTPGDQLLREYAKHFKTVEADTTYYRAPKKDVVKAWADQLPDGFVMAAKVPRKIVVGRDAPAPDVEKLLNRDAFPNYLDYFLAGIAELGAKAGPLLFQFPKFSKKVFPEAGPFLDRLDAYLAGLPAIFRYAVEVRNPEWVAPPLLAVLKKHRTALALAELDAFPATEVTADFVYVRLIGDRKKMEAMTESFDQPVVDRAADVARWGAALTPVQANRIYVYAGDYYAGPAVP